MSLAVHFWIPVLRCSCPGVTLPVSAFREGPGLGPGYLTARNNVLVVTTDVPPDVEAVLTQLFEESREAFERGDRETGVATVNSAATVARTKLPECTLRAHVLHGCERAEAVATAGDDDTAVAAEYVAAMERRLADATAE